METIFAAWSIANDFVLRTDPCAGGGNDAMFGSSKALVDVTWFVGMSTDAHTWSVSELPPVDKAWPRCVGPGRSAPHNSPEATFGENRNLPVPVLDTVKDELFVAINRSGDNKRLPQTVGNRVRLFGTTSSTLSNWTPIPLPRGSGPPLFDQWGEWLSFVHVPGEAHGRLALTWYSTATDPNGANRQITVHGTFSTDDGATFAPIISVASGAGVPWFLTDRWGDYNGSAGSPVNGRFLPAWADTRDGADAELWGRAVTP